MSEGSWDAIAMGKCWTPLSLWLLPLTFFLGEVLRHWSSWLFSSLFAIVIFRTQAFIEHLTLDILFNQVFIKHLENHSPLKVLWWKSNYPWSCVSKSLPKNPLEANLSFLSCLTPNVTQQACKLLPILLRSSNKIQIMRGFFAIHGY